MSNLQPIWPLTINGQQIKWQEFRTSYFAKLNDILNTPFMVPVSICGKAPDWYSGIQYKKLAPSWSIYSDWKFNHHDNEIYTKRFNEEILGKLDPKQVISELLERTDGKQPCLICYEKPMDFCHRHLVADWLNANGIIGFEVLFFTKREQTIKSPLESDNVHQ